jgi:CRP/FNR family cyclic AMP-dependent transcriptional regulator
MVTKELIASVPLFSKLNAQEQQQIAGLADDVTYQAGTLLFDEGQAADHLYVLLDGSVELLFAPREQVVVPAQAADALEDTLDFFFAKHSEQDTLGTAPLLIGEVHRNEPYGLSALIEPYRYTTGARAVRDGRSLKIRAAALRSLCAADPVMGYTLVRRVAQAAYDRLNYTRLQLVAARV